MSDREQVIRLDIPAQPAYVGVARSLVASVMSTMDDVDDDRLEDLRLAVSEACTNAIGPDGGDGRIVLSCRRDDEAVEIRVEGSGDDRLDPAVEGGWSLQLISALVDDVSFDRADQGMAVTLRVHLDQ